LDVSNSVPPGRRPRHAIDVTIVGTSAAIERVRQDAERVAQGDAKTLITGESGVGKDVVARYIHARSRRGSKRFVAVNCAGLTETLLESELFGHVKGAFTGAYRDKMGKLQLAHEGTIFLDEVGEMTPRMQALMLRFLENGEIHPVGADERFTAVDVRIIAATNRNLMQLVESGHFREDLLYRIRVVEIVVPPLRARTDDIRPLIQHFVQQSGRRLEFTEQAWQALTRYGWRGNVRELQNLIEQITWMSDPGIIDVQDLPPHIVASATVRRTRRAIERRRRPADDLYDGVTTGRYDFWQHVHQAFLKRDIARRDVKELIQRGLSTTNGNYRFMLRLFRMPETDYKRLLNFLTAHDCAVNFRPFRSVQAGDADVDSSPNQ
jgi:transcriptional regulator with PAS, ATPase and Fis domain